MFVVFTVPPAATMNPQYERELAVAIRSVCRAARLCRAVRSEISPDVLAKQDRSPVTVADFGSQALVCEALAEAFPDDPVVAEEDALELRQPQRARILQDVVRYVGAALGGRGSGITGEATCRWIDHGGATQYGDRFWTLDPIDGTKGFLRGEQYAIALALIVGGRVVVAALACPNLKLQTAPRQGGTDPAEGVIASAVRGQGTFVSGAAGEAERPLRARISVSHEANPARARYCESVEAGHSAQGDSALVAARLGISAPPLRMDSQAKYAAVAGGEAEIYLRLPTRSDYREKIWDHAAGTLIVEEAGGVVTDIDGRPLEFNHGRELVDNRGVIVTNGRLHQSVVEAVRGLGIGSE
jgi:3'(2'), 5'-bisphosphate nucleotidase